MVNNVQFSADFDERALQNTSNPHNKSGRIFGLINLMGVKGDAD